jgi:hypothetical protein
VNDHTLTPTGSERDLVTIDSSVAHTSRIYDYLLGGTDNFAVDREVATHAFAAYPGGLDGARADARANRAFLGRVVAHLVRDVGIRQFLDIGTGIPTADNTHAIAQDLAPDARTVYVDNDPIVLAHAHALLRSTPEGSTAYVSGDLCEPEAILHQAAATLDFSRPVAVVLVGLLHVIPDESDPFGHVATLVDAVAPGSHLALSHMTNEVQADEMAEVHDRLAASMRTMNPPALRPLDQIRRFVEGLELIEPGIVPVTDWRPVTPAARDRVTPVYGAVARKP